ncbi:MAG: hypothetical protein JO282_08270, partial [Alphaproteobacteria bacterium]|nr:hypothetical protein [Alphaproteobacteria bacterium]
MASLAKLSSGKLFAIASLAVGLGFSSSLLAGSVSDGPAPAPQKGVNIAGGPKAPSTDEPIARLQMASDLLAFGRDTRDPLVLIVAARITKALGGTEVDLKPEGRTATESAQKSGQPVSADSILVEARDLAKGEKITNLLIDETVTMGAAAGAGQPKTHQDTVQAGATDVYSVVFSGGQLAEAGLAGDGSGDLDLLVYDENDHLVCRSTGSSDREYCRWWPRWTGSFRIE